MDIASARHRAWPALSGVPVRGLGRRSSWAGDRDPVFDYGSAPAAACPAPPSRSPIRPRSQQSSTACASLRAALIAAWPRSARR